MEGLSTPRSGRRSSFRRSLSIKLAVVALSLLACEVALQIGSVWSVTIRRTLMPLWELNAPTVPDSRLVRRGNPDHREHDSAGYRNPSRLRQADIVVLGDSHAYGPALAADGWPRRTAQELGRSVYNMALPGYGPGHSLLQLDEALALTPRLVVVAPYFGNDFFETHVLARRHPQLLAGIDPALREAAAAEDRRRAIEQEVGRLFAVAAAQRAQHWVSSHMKLYGLARALRTHLSSPPATPAILSRDFALAAAALTPDERRYASPLDAGTWRTVLTSAYRHQVLDDSDPRIRLGFEAARAALLTMHERCRAAGIPLLVVLLPTKESVFWPRVRDPAAHPGLEGLVANEARLRGELIAALAAREIPHVNVLRPLRSSPAQTYFEDVDGHPNATGHAVIAATVTEHARRLLR